MIKFKEEFKDIVDVDKVSAFCFGAKDDVTPESIARAGGASKFSSLCGFKFVSKVNPTYNHGELRLVFCAKLRSKIYRKATESPSQWFIFLRTGKNQVEVLSKKDCMTAFDFDVEKFFDSDLFLKYAPVFKSTVQSGLRMAMDVISKTDIHQKIIGTSDTVQMLPRYTKAIEESIGLIQSGKINDKTFTLTMDFEDPNKKLVQKRYNAEKFADFLRDEQKKTKDKIDPWKKK